MFSFLLILHFFSLSYATEIIQNTSPLKENKNNGGSAYISPGSMIHPNRTFFDKSDNILRIPNAFYEENKRKSKIKKTPKRTIQKIIRKNTVKRKRIYVNPATRIPTMSTLYYNPVSNMHSRYDDIQTTETNSRRRSKKNPKVLRYHMPFHKLQPRTRRNKREITDDYITKDIERDIFKFNGKVMAKDVFRIKRNANTDNILILKDLDEIEFVGDDKDYDVVKSHVQYNW